MNELFARDFDSDEEDEEYIPDKKELEEDKVEEISKKEVNMSKVDEIWKKLKGQSKKDNNNILNSEKESRATIADNNSKSSLKNTSEKEESSGLPNNDSKSTPGDDEIMKAINKMKELKNKTMTETIHFAGQKFEYQKTASEDDIKKQKDKEKKKTHSGLDNIMQMIEKKGNVNTYTKTKKDWNNYVEEKNLEKELDYNRKDGFLKKKQFIESTNMKIIENTKTAKRQKTDHHS